MGLLARVIQFARVVRNGENGARVTSDPGGGANITPYHMPPVGDDSQPLPGDIAAVITTQRTGGHAAVGYTDPQNAGVAEAGEKRIYSRDSDGNIKASIYLKNDGTIELENDGGASLRLLPNGDVVINGQVFATHTHGPGTMAAGGDPVTGVTDGVT